jgi:hypothetical protein
MNTRHSRRISRKAAEQLLDGAAGPGPDGPARPDAPGRPDQLVSLLAAAAAPGREHERAGEQMAVAAFEANHLAPDASFRREEMLKSPLAKILTTKIIAAGLLVTATGGVALAASTGTFSGSAPASGGTSAGAVPSTSASPGAQASPGTSPSIYAFPTATASPSATATASASAAASPAASASAETVPQGATALCRALISTANSTGSQALSQAQQVQALASSALPQVLNGSEFTALISTAQSAIAVPDYCALILDLPQLPQPGDLTQLPVTVLTQVLAQVPVATLTQVLTSLPSSTLSAVLAELPASTVTSILTELPSSVVSQLLSALPTATLTQILTELPKSAETQILNELPTSVVTQLLNELPSSALSGVLSGLPSSLLSGLPSSLLSGL